MTKKLKFLLLFVLTLIFLVQCSKDKSDQSYFVSSRPADKGNKPVSESVNNLSFPAIAMDGFTITSISGLNCTVPYTGDYPGLTDEEIAILTGNGPWYPQKTEGNVWQADYDDQQSEVNVSFVDWGDNIESVNPKVRTPFRLEVTLYKALAEPMLGYTMAVLEYPSSSNELQGTNTNTYENDYATVISADPKLVIQYLGADYPEPEEGEETFEFEWDGSQWNDFEIVPVSFGPELNVGGKYIYGASSGGWKPDQPGWYRLTFYVPSGSGISLSEAVIGNFEVPTTEEGITAAAEEDGGATPVVIGEDNLSYVDVEVLGKGGGGRRQ